MFICLHKNLNGEKSQRYFLNWSNAQASLDADVKKTCKKYGGEIHNKVVDTSGNIWKYEVYAYLGEHGGCSWYLSEEYFEDQ